MKKIIFLLFLPLCGITQPNKPIVHECYNQPAPGAEPAIFSSGIISDEYGNRDMAISATGDELFYTLQYRSGFVFSTIMHAKKTNGNWSKPEVAAFCGRYNDMEPAFSPDGKRLYFTSARPDTGTAARDYDIWYVTKMNGGWGNPVNLGSPVNSSEDEFYPSVTNNGNIYFTRAVKGREEDIMMCRYLENKYAPAEQLPDVINSTGDEFNAFVDADEKIIVFTGYKRQGNFGSGDLFYSVKDKNGEWGLAKNMGSKINGTGLSYCPFITANGKYFFFSSSRGMFKTPFTEKQNFKTLKSYMHSPLNGWDNIYWMETRELFH